MAESPANQQVPEDDPNLESQEIEAGQGGENGDGGGEPEDQQVPSWREQAGQFGLDLSSFEDDESAFRHLSDRISQADSLQGQLDQSQQLVQYGQEYLRHAADFQKWQQEQEAARQQEAPDPYAPPEYDPAWVGMVHYDDNGVLVPNPARGGTPEIVSKLQAHLQWRQNFAADPFKYLESFVDRRAEERARELVQSEISKVNTNFHTQSFISNNRDWLFARDQSGAPVMEGGKMKLSEEGAKFSEFLGLAAQRENLSEEDQQWAAMQMLDLWRASRATAGQGGQGDGKSAADKSKEDFLTSAAGYQEQPSASTRRTGKVKEPPQNENQSLADMLRADFAEAGLTDADFASV